MIADLRRLVSGNSCSSNGQVIEASSRVRGTGSALGSSISSSGGSSSFPPVPGPAPRVERPRRTPGPARTSGRTCPSSGKDQAEMGDRATECAGIQGGVDFVPWAPANTEGPQDLEEEEQ